MSSLIFPNFQGAIRMKTSLVAMVLALAAVLALGPAAAAQAPAAQPAPAAQAAPSQPAAPVIKDPAEYNAYVGAIQQSDPAAKISGLEAFLVQYPNSVVNPTRPEGLLAPYN